jgi:hypothetical protein
MVFASYVMYERAVDSCVQVNDDCHFYLREREKLQFMLSTTRQNRGKNYLGKLIKHLHMYECCCQGKNKAK